MTSSEFFVGIVGKWHPTKYDDAVQFGTDWHGNSGGVLAGDIAGSGGPGFVSAACRDGDRGSIGYVDCRAFHLVQYIGSGGGGADSESEPIGNGRVFTGFGG